MTIMICSGRFRGFGFVSYVTADNCAKALEAMNGGEVDSRIIKVERARRNTGYQKTPGQCTFPMLDCVLII